MFSFSLLKVIFLHLPLPKVVFQMLVQFVGVGLVLVTSPTLHDVVWVGVGCSVIILLVGLLLFLF